MCYGGNFAGGTVVVSDSKKLKWLRDDVKYYEDQAEEARKRIAEIEAMIAEGSDKPDEPTV